MISDEVFVDYRYTDRPGDVRVAAAARDGRARSCSRSAGSRSPRPSRSSSSAGSSRTGPPTFSPTRFARLEWIADAYLSVGDARPARAPEASRGQPRGAVEAIWARVLRNERALRAAFPRGPAVAASPVAAGWAACLQRARRFDPEEEIVLDLLESHDVLVQPGYFFDFPFEAFLVVSLLPPPDVFREGIERLAQALAIHA